MNKPSWLASLFAATLITLAAVLGVTVAVTGATSNSAAAEAVYDTAITAPVAIAVATATVPISGVLEVTTVVAAAPEVAVAFAVVLTVLAVFALMAIVFAQTALGRKRPKTAALYFTARGHEHQWSTRTKNALRQTKERVMRNLQPAYSSRLSPG